MSVDLILHRPDRAITLEEMVDALARLAPDAELAEGVLRFWQLETMSVEHCTGWTDEELEAMEREVFAHDHVVLAGPTRAWPWMLHVAAHLCDVLTARAFDPQNGDMADLSLAPSRQALRESLPDGTGVGASTDAAPPPSYALDQWLAWGWIELSTGANPVAVATALEKLIDQQRENFDAFMTQLLALPGVEEVFADDDELGGFIAIW